MKKLLWVLGGLFFAFLVAIVSIPLFVDVDQYRPTIVAEANKRINGKLELGKLKLGLWGAIKIHAESIKLSVNGFPEPLLDTKQFHLEIPFLSLLSGTPQVIAVLDSPKINVVKDPSGKTNAMELMKTAEAAVAPPAEQSAAAEDSVSVANAATAKKAAPAAKPAEPPVAEAEPAAAPPAPPAAPAEPTKVPAIVAGAKIGLRIRNGDLRYSDKLAKSDYQVAGLELNARNLGLGSTMEIDLKAPVNGSTPTLSFSGPVAASAQLTPVLVSGSVKSVRGKLDLDASGLKVEMKSGAFRKTDSMALKMNMQLEGDERETLLRALDVVFADMKIHGKGRVVLEPMSAKINISADPGSIRLDKVQSFVPMAEPYQLKGSADFNADIDWKPEAMKINGDLKVSDGSFFLKDTLKAPLGFLVQAGFSESSLNLTRAALSGPETELELRGTVKNFLAPQFSFALTGKSFNVDKTIVMPAKDAKTASAYGFLIPEAHAAPAADGLNPLLAMAKNPMFAGAAGTFTAQVARVIVQGATLDQVNARLQLNAMLLKILDASLRTFGGSVKASGQADLKTPGLTFSTQGSLSDISAQAALKTYFPKYERTLEGMVNGSWNISGAAYPAATRMRSLRGTAKVLAKDGVVKSVDFQESINSAMAKIPFLKNQKPIKVDNGFKTFTADIKFDGGTIHAEPIEVLPRNQGFVVKGKSTIRESLDQETFLDVYDPQGQLPKELQNPGKPAIPLRIYGPITAPITDYDYTLKRVVSNAGKNVLKDQALKALGVGNSPGKSDKDKLKDAADQLRKKFGF